MPLFLYVDSKIPLKVERDLYVLDLYVVENPNTGFFPIIIEPLHEKTNNLGSRPGPTQIRICRLEA